MFKKYKLRDFNFILALSVIVLMVLGVFLINSADSSFTIKQAVGVAMAVVIIIVVSLTIILVYPMFQKHFVKGVMLGSLKG